eukprot:gene29098-12935_t
MRVRGVAALVAAADGDQPPPVICIVGSGISGAATAYYTKKALLQKEITDYRGRGGNPAEGAFFVHELGLERTPPSDPNRAAPAPGPACGVCAGGRQGGASGGASGSDGNKLARGGTSGGAVLALLLLCAAGQQAHGLPSNTLSIMSYNIMDSGNFMASQSPFVDVLGLIETGGWSEHGSGAHPGTIVARVLNTTFVVTSMSATSSKDKYQAFEAMA